jgi:hypothetical protein
VATSSSSLQMSAEDLVGASTETGGVWDPLGLASDDAKLYKCVPSVPCASDVHCAHPY